MIDETGKQLGVMKLADALRLAKEHELDLVEVGPNVKPPIVKVMDYGKYLYQKAKQEKKSGVARPKELETKTVRVGFKTGVHDLKFKAKKADEFLSEGHLVKVELTLRGREKALAHLGKEKLSTFLTMLATPYTSQGEPRRSPYGWVVMIQKSKQAQRHESHENEQVAVETNKDNRKE